MLLFFLIFVPVMTVMIVPALVMAVVVPLMMPVVAVVIPAMRQRRIWYNQHSKTDNYGEYPQIHRFVR
jgi:hypothetical protein